MCVWGAGGRPSGDAYVLHPQVQVWTLKAGYASSTSSWTPSVYLACPRAQTRGEKATSATEPRDYKGGPRPPLSCLGSWSAPRLRRSLLPPPPPAPSTCLTPAICVSRHQAARPAQVVSPSTPPQRPPPASGPRRTEARRGRPGRAAPGAISTRERVLLARPAPPTLPPLPESSDSPPPPAPTPLPRPFPQLFPPAGDDRGQPEPGKAGRRPRQPTGPKMAAAERRGERGERAGGRASGGESAASAGSQPASPPRRPAAADTPSSSRRRRPGAPRPSPASALGTRAAQPTPFYFRDPVRR